MTTVTKTVRFDAAHVLTNHRGLCKNLHGHTYRVDISVAGDESDDMVMDFKELKSLATEVICGRFDHAFIYNTGSVGECEIAQLVERYGMRTVAIPFRSTAENLAKHFYDLLSERMQTRPVLVSVKVWETVDSCAEYRRQ
ncbi:MAG: 6-carboxytetrahydropterin synthase QueD [Kiritimatiellae bacterium]|jgi:6-pyruvoyltetrahydropterin/6-carboxytetrahydropterin synthase|nr:6-carboxytetrahydropterin synthase QueD [Kiritimatiellia bacterium]